MIDQTILPADAMQLKEAILNKEARIGSGRQALLEAAEEGLPEVTRIVNAEAELPEVAKSFGRVQAAIINSKFKVPGDDQSGLTKWLDHQHRIKDILHDWQTELSDKGQSCSNADLVIALFNTMMAEHNLMDLDLFVKLYVRAVNWR